METNRASSEYGKRLFYFFTAFLSYRNPFPFLAEKGEQVQLLSILLMARLARLQGEALEEDIVKGLAPFLIKALKEAEESMTDTRVALFLTTMRRALEQDDYEGYTHGIEALLQALDIDSEGLDRELKRFEQFAALLTFSFQEGMEDKTNKLTGITHI